MTATAPGVLNGNLIPQADSDFESALTGNWVAFTNCSVAVSALHAFTGTQSLEVTATANGDVVVLVGNTKFPLTALTGQVVSYQVWTPNTSRTCHTNIWYYTSGGTFISFPSLPAHTLDANAWTPVADAGTSPATTGLGQMAVTISGMLAGEKAYIDLVYVTSARMQVLIDWANPPFSASSIAGTRFSDITPFVRADRGIDFSRGRQDAISSVEAGSASFTVYNTPGWFTANRSGSPWYPNVKLGRRCQINFTDETGAWHTRFDGPIASVDYTFTPNGEAEANIGCADVMAYLARATLNGWTRELVALDLPAYTWALDDAAGSTAAVESSGNNGPPLRIRQYVTGSNAATLDFQGGSGGIETQANAPTSTRIGNPSNSPLPSPYFTTKVTDTFGIGNSSSRQLSVALPAMSTRASNDHTFECWVTPDNSSLYTGNSLKCVFSLGDTRSGKNFTLGWWTSGFGSGWVMQTWNFPLVDFPGTSGPPLSNPLPINETDIVATMPDPGVPVHLVLKVAGSNSGATATLYINGTSSGTIALPKFFAPDWLDVGGAFGGQCGWEGNITLFSIYNYALSTGQITAHQGMGSDAMYLQNTGTSIQQLAAFAALPSFWSNLSANGLGVAEYIDVTGTDPQSAMQQFESAELAGLLYVDAAGKLNFDGRQIRMGASAPDVTLPAGSFSEALGYKITDQYQVTEASIGSPTATKAATVINVPADQDYSPHTAGTPASPESLPVLSQAPEFNLRGLPGGETQLDPYLTDAAAWKAYRTATPPFKVSSLTVDVATLTDPTSSDYVALSALYGLEINKIARLSSTVTSFPDDFGALDFFIEGIDEHFDNTSHTLTFYTTPANLARCWKPGDATWGALDTTAVIGVGDKLSHSNAPRSKIHSADPGPPFWPPAYASTMNNGGVTGKGFVGATDQRGIFDTLQKKQTPPLCVVGQVTNNENLSSGTAAAEQTLFFDTTFIDSAGGYGIRPGFPNFYVVQIPGFYALNATVQFAPNATGNRFARFIVHFDGVNGDPTGSGAISAAGSERTPPTGKPAVVTLATRLYCGVGTTIGVRVWQDSGSTITTGVALANGSLMSVCWTGYSTTAD